MTEFKPIKEGKVREIYDNGDSLIMVATDRISAFDFVLQTPVPDKGKVLTQISTWWFSQIADILPNHLIETDAAKFPAELAPFKDQLEGHTRVNSCGGILVSGME